MSNTMFVNRLISLENICLNVVVQEFETFHSAYAISNSHILKRNMEFLHRRYSYELGTELLKNENLKDEYLEFLLNEHLKILNWDWFLSSLSINSIIDILQRLPNLTKVFCSRFCNDVILENLAKFCFKLVELDVSFSNVTDNGIKYLCKNDKGFVPCPKLKILNILRTRITDEGVEYLIQDLHSLEKIYHKNLPKVLYSRHKKDLLEFGSMHCYNLVELNTLNCTHLPYYNDLLKICLKMCPNLKAIRCSITRKEQLSLFHNICIKELYLEYSPYIENIKYENASNFLKSNGGNLTYLKLRHWDISAIDLAASCPKLKHLCLCQVSFTDNQDSEFLFPSLVRCDLEWIWDISGSTHEESKMCKAIRFLLLHSPKLRVLKMYNCSLYLNTEREILKFCENDFLKEITFEECFIYSDDVKKILLNCPSLIFLNLYDCDFNDQEIEEFRKFAQNLPNRPCISVDRFERSKYDYDY